MSNTPNPRRKVTRPTPVIEMFKLYRNEAGDVVLRSGAVRADDYETVRSKRPELALPELRAIPFAE